MGKILTLEGCTGVGKSTQMRVLTEQILNKGFKIAPINELDYEPCKSVVHTWRTSELGRKKLYTWQVVQDMANARLQVHNEILTPLLKNVNFILLDRSYITNAIYQSDSGFSPYKIIELHKRMGVLPIDRGYILDCPPELSFDRAYNRNLSEFEEGGGFEFERKRFMIPVEKLEDIQKRHLLYREITGKYPELKIINSNRVQDEITQDIVADILTL